MNTDLVVNKTNSISYFNYLLKRNLLSVFKGEDLNSVTLDYKLIFIFNDITWSNIVFLFKVKGVNVYGGSSNRRHLLSTVQAQLMSFLLLINDFSVDSDLVYRSFNDVTTSNAKIDYQLIDYIKHGEKNKNLNKYNLENSSNGVYLLRINIIFHLYLEISSVLNKIDNVNTDISKLTSDIKNDNSTIAKYSKNSNSLVGLNAHSGLLKK